MPSINQLRTLARWRKAAGDDWQAVFRKRLDLLHEAHQSTGRPHLAWEALLLSRGLAETPPMWVMDFLADVGSEVHNVAVASAGDEAFDAETEKTRIGGMCLGRADMLPSYRDHEWMDSALMVADELHNTGKETDAYHERAAKLKALNDALPGFGFKMSHTTLGDAWRRWKASFPSLVPDIAKRHKPRSGRPRKPS